MAIVGLATQSALAIPEIAHPISTAERWASYVLGACKAERDPRTLGIWAHEVGVSYTTLCESCRLIGVQPRHARDFARVLRVIVQSSLYSCQLASLLDISDRRTLHGILQNAGFSHHENLSREVSVTGFLNQQQFITPDNAGLTIVRDVFASYK